MTRQSDQSTKLKSPRAGDRPPGQRVVLFWSAGSAAYDLPPGAELSLGRAEECDVRIPDDSVSRQHAILRGGPPPSIEDLGSANGTFIADEQLTPHQPHPLAPSVVVEIGDALLVFQSKESAPAATEARAQLPAAALDPAMRRVYEIVDLVAKTTIPVLILGETGVGKGLIAETIHRRSSRAAAPFLRLNCAAIPETLLENELFGSERGAFTGAAAAKPGLLEAADGGTVLLDEVGDVPLAIQAKLLHALDHNEVMRVGALRPRTIDVRFVAATNRDLPERVREGQFREDLFFRLNGMTITIPPLRERRSELRSLVQTFIEEACAQLGHPKIGISDEALSRLALHDWPGNVRELRNVIVRAALFARGGRIGVEHFEPAETPNLRSGNLRSAVRELEHARIVEMLEACGHNQVETAKRLGVSRGTLRSRMKELGLLPQK